ncbi:MAG: ATP-binding protein [Candidatus Cloacimonadota bacterium]|nr:MAG: ATP-binding protein [Candidatus Cloacimonadota bacterium]PIE79109.1 MAG: ATP-binding protein [Candidatus Delongbacteria bacterium]
MRTISHHIIDIAHNSIRGNGKTIEISIVEAGDNLTISIVDDGRGIDSELMKIIDDPYGTTRESRKVGMGIPLIKFHAEKTGGTFKIESKKGVGTKLEVLFSISNIDRQPMGDLPGSITQLFCSVGEEVDIIFSYKTPSGEFGVSLNDIREVFDGIPLSSSKVFSNIKGMIKSQLEEIGSVS